mmetsp:Transcript_45620/g.89870  ORF Transcript_45620/g.89870 Transcript_45620/m.89870 type:complete len:94 (-) Transcript_45620:1599-1880(-)
MNHSDSDKSKERKMPAARSEEVQAISNTPQLASLSAANKKTAAQKTFTHDKRRKTRHMREKTCQRKRLCTYFGCMEGETRKAQEPCLFALLIV